jgi:hypothetical protein
VVKVMLPRLPIHQLNISPSSFFAPAQFCHLNFSFAPAILNPPSSTLDPAR